MKGNECNLIIDILNNVIIYHNNIEYNKFI